MVIPWQSVKKGKCCLSSLLLSSLYFIWRLSLFHLLVSPRSYSAQDPPGGAHLCSEHQAAFPCRSLPFMCSSLLRDPWSNLSSGEGLRPCLLELCRAVWQCLHQSRRLWPTRPAHRTCVYLMEPHFQLWMRWVGSCPYEIKPWGHLIPAQQSCIPGGVGSFSKVFLRCFLQYISKKIFKCIFF